MRKLWMILLLLIGAIALDRVDVVSQQETSACEISDIRTPQLANASHHNIDAERTSSVVVPSVRVTTTTTSRSSQQRLFAALFVEHYQTITNYSTERFLHRISHFARAVDYYLYMLCVLRL